MQILRRTSRGALVATTTVLLALVAATAGLTGAAGAARAVVPTVPQASVARQAAGWLVGQLTSGGYIVGSTPGTADYSSTVNTLLALAAAGVDLPLARTGLSYMETNADAYIAAEGSDGPGQLSLLILLAHALGVDPTNFGGTNLVARLLATEQTSGANAGRFGTDAQVADYDSGPYDQGLALAALEAAGVSANAAATTWLQQAQCPNGGWTAPDSTTNPCNGDPALGDGPDTNTTSLALQGLAAQGALPQSVESSALTFLKNGQNADGGWAYDPNAADNNTQTSDPDSTALVIQALVALGLSPDAAQFDVGGHTPTALVLSFEVTSGSGSGGFSYPGSSGADLLATYQAVPALMGLSFPFGAYGTSYLVASSTGGVFAFGGAPFHGSLGGTALNQPVVGIAPTLDGLGYWLAAADGGIFSFGNATFYGSMGGQPLNKPIVGIAATAGGGGYWEVAADGGIFGFGNAQFYGSMGGKTLNKPIVGIASTPDGGGYWEVASDGGIFSFGDAQFYGSTGSLALNAPITGMSTTAGGDGYWLVASDGGVFNFGAATYSGSAAPYRITGVVGLTASAT